MPPKLGDIFKFETEKATGYSKRGKYHLAIDLGRGFLLFINSEPFDGAMRITKDDWPEMPKEESYISCSAAIRYKKSDLKGVKITPSGRLTDECLRNLENHISSSWVLPINDIDEALLAFREYFPP